MCINIHTCTSSVLPRILLRRSGRVCICHVHKQHIQMFNINAPVNVYLHYFPPRLPKVHCARPGDLTSLSLRLFQVVLLFLVLDSSKDHVDGWNYQQPGNTSQSDSLRMLSFVIKMSARHFMHVVYKLLRMLKMWRLPKAHRQGIKNRNTTWNGLLNSLYLGAKFLILSR